MALFWKNRLSPIGCDEGGGSAEAGFRRAGAREARVVRSRQTTTKEAGSRGRRLIGESGAPTGAGRSRRGGACSRRPDLPSLRSLRSLYSSGARLRADRRVRAGSATGGRGLRGGAGRVPGGGRPR